MSCPIFCNCPLLNFSVKFFLHHSSQFPQFLSLPLSQFSLLVFTGLTLIFLLLLKLFLSLLFIVFCLNLYLFFSIASLSFTSSSAILVSSCLVLFLFPVTSSALCLSQMLPLPPLPCLSLCLLPFPCFHLIASLPFFLPHHCVNLLLVPCLLCISSTFPSSSV